MNFNKFYLECKKNGIEDVQLVTHKTRELSIDLFHGELDTNSVSESTILQATGIYNGKKAYVSFEKNDNKYIPEIIKLLKESISHIEKEEKLELFKGSKKYSKKIVYNPNLEKYTFNDKFELLKLLESTAKALDPRIVDVEVGYGDIYSETIFENSYSLKLKHKENYALISINVIVSENNDTQSAFEVIANTDLKDFNVEEIAKNCVNKALKKLNGQTIKNKSYKAILSQDVVAKLIDALMEHVSSEEVQKHTSQFENKLNTLVLSKKLTILEKPLSKNIFFRYFDDEGVATYNKKIIDKGVLKTYLYNLETAKKDNVDTTGNGYKSGGKIVVGYSNLEVKNGTQSFENLLKKVKNGVYITGVSGLHAGLDSSSGNFSLQSEGFIIENGEITKPTSLIVISGNLFTIFNEVIALANDSKLILNQVSTPSIAIKKLKISN